MIFHPALTLAPSAPGNYTVVSELGSGRKVGLLELPLEGFAMILGSVVGLLVVVAATAAYCYCHSVRRKESLEKDAEKLPGEVVKGGALGSGGASVESLDSVVKECPVEGQNGGLSPVQSWGASTLLQEHERRLSVGGSMDAAHLHYPDVTQYMGVAMSPTPLPPMPEDPHAQDGPESPLASYTSYAAIGWDEPLTGHLLPHPPLPRHAAMPPMPPMPPAAAIGVQLVQAQQLDRKRRNVTQV